MKGLSISLLTGFLFFISITSWLLIILITPVGGWNPNTPQYDSLYAPMFTITGIASMITAVLFGWAMSRES